MPVLVTVGFVAQFYLSFTVSNRIASKINNELYIFIEMTTLICFPNQVMYLEYNAFFLTFHHNKLYT